MAGSICTRRSLPRITHPCTGSACAQFALHPTLKLFSPRAPFPPLTLPPLQDVAEALRRLPPEVVVARNQRLKRAMDLSMKHEKLPKELRDKQTPFEHYLLVGLLAFGRFLGFLGGF